MAPKLLQENLNHMAHITILMYCICKTHFLKRMLYM